MNERSVTPFINWLMFMLVDAGALEQGVQRRQNGLTALAGMGLIAGIIYLFIIMRHNNRELKPVRVRVRR